ncbi:MAG: CRISPR-associated protein Cas4 [Candidatus Sumerlaeota bacterium]|nr:CRISPR-associated protein Cas4 [Candidatus Sumerlaeota bacterium]
MFDEDDLLPISALQHLAFCERQCALIHIESLWDENVLTAEGRVLHERTHEGETESRGDVRIARGVRLRSLRLGLIGMADVVEFHRRPENEEQGARLKNVGGRWLPFPVEYKRGRPKSGRCDEIQLCAQAICLEEMLGIGVERGALFYGQPRRRQEVALDEALREVTEETARRLHALIASGRTPPARYEKKCENCSLLDRCLPRLARGGRSARQYLDQTLRAMEDEQP